MKSIPSAVYVNRVMKELTVGSIPMIVIPFLVKMEEFVRWGSGILFSLQNYFSPI